MRRADYTYEVDGNTLKIIDLDKGGMSVTNAAEDVLTEINQQVNIENMEIRYRDSMGRWDGMRPEFLNGKCVNVYFI